MAWRGALKEHEKFIAFCLLGGGLMALVVLLIFNPVPDESEATKQAVTAVVGALTLAFGAATQALFRIRDPGENTVTVDNTASQPVPVDPA